MRLHWDTDAVEAARLWRKGLPISQIAEKTGKTYSCISAMARRNRDEFPQRKRSFEKPKPAAVAAVAEPIVQALPSDRVVRVTAAGTKVTMPRVTLIDGAAL